MKQIKKKYSFIVVGSWFVLLVSFLTFASCKTTPPPLPDETMEQENLAKDAEKARAGAIEKGADKTHSDLFLLADKRLTVAKGMVTSNRDEAVKEFRELVLVYKTLEKLAQAKQIKQDIDEMGFADLNPQMYKNAEDLYNDALSRCGKDEDGALKASEQALSLYGELCDKGFSTLIEQAKAEAKVAKEKCDSVNASRNMATEYNVAVKLYNEGAVMNKEKRYRQAYKSYLSARDAFNKIFDVAESRKKEAEAALKRAKAKMRESSALAKEADKASPLKAGVQGFGEVDSSSLENKDSDRQEVEEIAD